MYAIRSYYASSPVKSISNASRCISSTLRLFFAKAELEKLFLTFSPSNFGILINPSNPVLMWSPSVFFSITTLSLT